MASLAAKGPRMFFPNMSLFVKPKGNFLTSKGVVTFVVPPSMTKFEIKKYIESIYGIGVIKVNTQVYQGKMKRDIKGRWFRHNATKKAIVTLDNSVYLDKLQAIAAGSGEEKKADE